MSVGYVEQIIVFSEDTALFPHCATVKMVWWPDFRHVQEFFTIFFFNSVETTFDDRI